ncbi:MAG: hypothetical protein AB7V48_10490 [Sedimentibacter sp.]
MDLLYRINQLIYHHDLRLAEILEIILTNPGLNAYDIAGKMKWSLKDSNWDNAPVQQKWFAVGETLAHLDYLEIENKVCKKLIDNIYYYFIRKIF